MTAQLSLSLSFDRATRERDLALGRIARVISPAFVEHGERFVVAYLTAHGEVPGEDLTDAAERIGGIRPSNAKHWGHVIARLLRQKRIEKCGTAMRRKGHRCSGGNVYRLVE